MPQDKLNAFEAKLRNSLMPTAISRQATDGIHAMLDELAGMHDHPPMVVANVLNPPRKKPWSAAAAAAAIIAVSTWWLAPSFEHLAQRSKNTGKNALESLFEPIRIIEESIQLSAIEDEGWFDDPDGTTHRAVRVRVLAEDRLLDAETGLIVHVASPREEMLLMPVSSF